MWTLWQTAKAFGTRPSELLALGDQFAAYCIDNAVAEWGMAVEAQLNKVEGKTDKERMVKAERTLRKWLDMPEQYRSPSASDTRKA
jgi:hypothetical protein